MLQQVKEIRDETEELYDYLVTEIFCDISFNMVIHGRQITITFKIY